MIGFDRREVLTLGVLALLTACTPAESSSSRQKKAPEEAPVRTDTAPLERRFPVLGTLSDAHWSAVRLGSDSRLSPPGPSDIRVVGLARLEEGRSAALVKERKTGFRPQAPDQVPDSLAGFLPDGAKWVSSEAFDREITGDVYPGGFFLDPVSDSVYFDTLNPFPAAGSTD
ncbi:hypothetical protein FHS43_006831 [Streptosporangium becharense]|uniref:Uncharacterized protein n=1 Tax=Streptosporangium becharense TaxID=1816182 RepID=A0A7W9IIF6_9ACTN|nr:hypothetical protein [Streptosporangium becharense]MBB2915510.1 hypothetical protein [Streptosporangium becharense]MBB5821015.1 hypothetical protein [Streptosporangium becharense]